ncbi:flagellar hook-length control protein FliK [Rheinheimera tilapiae]|uniref:Flagellar hook-length control protein FliK n=1 Tax=Rheinheimera tilapiae TaxID=875043 RepID=A0ABV6BH22_9GAMM
MNLSINLTLGSPVTDSASSSAVITEDMSDQEFSLKLADELSERELAPLMLPEDGKATDPALLEQIAARQQIAADAETLTDKDGRVWQEDPLAGLAGAESADDESIDPLAGDKPWLDIIEKANSYSPVLQANKTNSRSAAESAVTESAAVAIDPKLEPLPADLAALSATQDCQAEKAQPLLLTSADLAKFGSKTESNSKFNSESESKVTTSTGLLSGAAKTDAGSVPVKTQTVAADPSASADVAPVHGTVKETESADVRTDGQLLQPVADEPVTKTTNAAATLPAPVTTATGASGQTDPESRTPVSTSGTTAKNTELQKVGPVTVNGQNEVQVTEAQTEQTDIPAIAAMQKITASGSDKQAAKTAAEPAVSASEQVAMQQETERQIAGQQSIAMTAIQAGTVTANRPTGTQTTGSDKAPAANAFAVHLRAVNQTQQQQQQQQQQPQSGAEQQPGQGQAKANIDMSALNLSGPVASATPVFAQQLQQVTETTPVAGTAGQAITSSAAITPGNTTLLSARPAESAALQPPLALTEPAAAQQIKDRVMVQIQHKLQTAEVQLHPEELGSMQIKLNLQQDQLSVQFVVQQGAAKEALEQQMPKLRELLEQQGIALSEGQVEQRQSRSQQEQHSGRHGNHAGAESELAAVQTVQMKVSDRMVDFYA